LHVSKHYEDPIAALVEYIASMTTYASMSHEAYLYYTSTKP